MSANFDRYEVAISRPEAAVSCDVPGCIVSEFLLLGHCSFVHGRGAWRGHWKHKDPEWLIGTNWPRSDPRGDALGRELGNAITAGYRLMDDVIPLAEAAFACLPDARRSDISDVDSFGSPMVVAPRRGVRTPITIETPWLAENFAFPFVGTENGLAFQAAPMRLVGLWFSISKPPES